MARSATTRPTQGRSGAGAARNSATARKRAQKAAPPIADETERVESRAGVTAATQEIRLATTMSGGVSLAIWMGGVAREINLLCQASNRRLTGDQSVPTGWTAATQRVSGIYSGLLDLLDLTVQTDVLSGTSAGGINSALLGLARVNDLDLGSLRQTWLNLGSLVDLLREPSDSALPSLMYGDKRLYQSLHEALDGLAAGVAGPADRPTDLFITTTLLSDEIRDFTDDLGTDIKAGDRRGVFRFTDHDLDADRNQEINEALALAARCSASFPLAFEPSYVPIGSASPGQGQYLARPDMAVYANMKSAHWAADGGLLDNYPIDVLLDTIFTRPADREVRRVLAYVVPSAKSKTEPAADLGDPPALVTGLLKDVGAVKAQSIAAPVRAIMQHNAAIDSQLQARLRLADFGVRLGRKRLLSDSTVRAFRDREIDRAASRSFTHQLLSGGPEADEGDLQRSPDRAAFDAGVPETVEEFDRYGDRVYNLALAIVLDLLRAAYAVAGRSGIAGVAAISSRVHGVRVADRWTALAAEAGGLVQQLDGRRDAADVDRLVPLLDYLAQPVTGVRDPVATRLFDLAVTHLAMLPPQATRDQPVEFVQISSDIACSLAPAQDDAVEKLTGEQLSHFGAFFKSSWRANDWMWGRLDGAQWLARILLDPRRIRTIAADRPDRKQPASAWFAAQLESLLGSGPTSDEEREAVGAELVTALDGAAAPGDDARPLLPLTAGWVARVIQTQVAAEELVNLATAVRQSEDGSGAEPKGTPHGSASAGWAADVVRAAAGSEVLTDDAKISALLRRCPVRKETLSGQSGTPLMVETASKAAATAIGAADAIPQVSKVLSAPLGVLRTVTLDAYRVVKTTRGARSRLALAGGAALVLGIALVIQGWTWAGIAGTTLLGIGAVLLAFAAWGLSRRAVAAVVSGLLVVAAVLPALCPALRRGLFGKNGSKKDYGLIGRHVQSWIADLREPHGSLIAGLVVLVVLPLLGFAIISALSHLRRVKPGRRHRR